MWPARSLEAWRVSSYAHQLAHALLDQRFDFSQWGLYPACTRGDDYCQARQALIEGDTALTTDRWLEQSAARSQQGLRCPQYQALPPAANDPAASPFIVRDVAFRNEYGRKFVEALYQRGGWAAVNKAYEDLPVSTEQIMHPEKYLAGEKPIEVAAVPVPRPSAATGRSSPTKRWVNGALTCCCRRTLTKRRACPKRPRRKRRPGGAAITIGCITIRRIDQSALVVEWVWDTPQDAAEFQQAMTAYLDLRFRGAKSQTPIKIAGRPIDRPRVCILRRMEHCGCWLPLLI